MFGTKVYKFSTVLKNNCFSNKVIVKLTNMTRAGKYTQLLFFSDESSNILDKSKGLVYTVFLPTWLMVYDL
jgi:protein tyrosine phosphatase